MSKPAPLSLLAAIRALVPHFAPCKACGAPATRGAQGRLRLSSGESTAAIELCDTCDGPEGGPLARYRWGQAVDLPYAAALRGVLAAIERAT